MLLASNSLVCYWVNVCIDVMFVCMDIVDTDVLMFMFASHYFTTYIVNLNDAFWLKCYFK